MEVRSDDIWIITFPKCGTTLTQVKKRKLFCFALNVKKWYFVTIIVLTYQHCSSVILNFSRVLKPRKVSGEKVLQIRGCNV